MVTAKQGYLSVPTKISLADSLKELMLRTSFEKITIQDITKNAGVIRPTFYKHFADKYALLEWIFTNEIIEPTIPLIEADMLKEAIDLMLRQIERNFKFYAKVARIEGQNSFEKIALDGFSKLFLEIFILKDTFVTNDFKPITPERLARYYANGLTFIIISWLSGDPTVPAALIGEIYQRISNISINGLVTPNSGYNCK